MAKATPIRNLREVVITTETQIGVTLELSNIEAHVIARLVGNIGGAYDMTDENHVRSIASALWRKLVDAGYGTMEHLNDSRSWFEDKHNYLAAKRDATVSDIIPGEPS